MANIITRNITTQIVTAKVVRMDDFTVTDITVTVPRDIKNPEAQLDFISKAYSGYKAVAVVNVEITEQMYGMTEEDFVKFAQPITKRSEVK